jgi:photosystem II stability/assembly factor-like uncharacterized protein
MKGARSWNRSHRAVLVMTLAPLSLLAAVQLPSQTKRGTPAAVRYDSAYLDALEYRMIGPSRGGRVTAVTGVPSEPRTFYMGAASGGVFKTTDAGATWLPIADEFFAVGSVGSIEVAPSNANIVYVGTGSESIRSNVSIGRGVYRSDDAGKTWRFVGLPGAGQIGSVRVHPDNPDLVYVAAAGNPFVNNPERGVFRSRDGGKSWEKVLYISDSTGAADLEFQPGHPEVIYAAMWRGQRTPWTIISGAREGGIYKSTDGGDHWTKLAGGLPDQLFGKANIAVTAANPDRVYALIEAKPGEGLYRSDDAGANWTRVSSQGSLITRPFYYTTIAADPTNADVVYAGAEGFFKSTDGGKSFRRFPTPHGDNHDMWINPHDGKIMIQANDGGVNVSFDGGGTWSTQYNQPTAEIYQVAVDSQYPYRLYGAQQDNTTLIVPSLPPGGPVDDPMQLWRVGPGCETGPIMPHPVNPDTVYGACKGQFSRTDLRTGQEQNYWVGAQYLYGFKPNELKYRFQRVSPMEISPHDPSVIYFGSQYVHRTRDGGVTWERISPDLTANEPSRQVISGSPITRDVTGEEYYSTVYAIRESPLETGVIWAGANDGPIHVTRDNGKTWTDVTPKDLPPGGRVQNIEPSPHRKGSAYVAVLRYLLGDFRPYIYRTDDYGKSWTLLTTGSNGIPADEPTRVVRESPAREGLLFAGTEFGAYVSFDNGASWRQLRLGLPVTPVTDMRIFRHDLVLSTQGRSFWILDDITPLEQLTTGIASSAAHLFTPRTAYRFHYRGGRGGDPSAPEFPPPGAMIDYSLGVRGARSVTLEVFDSNGKLVRRMESEATQADGQRASDARRARNDYSEIATTPGLHRVIWDLRYPGAWSEAESGRGRGGPMAAPGKYTLKLTVDTSTSGEPWTATTTLSVRADPRIVKAGVTQRDMEEQLAHNLRVRDALSEARRAAARVTAAVKRLDGATGSAADTLRMLTVLDTTLNTDPIRYSQPKLVDQLEYLYGMTTSADQRIGRDAVARYRELEEELKRVQAKVIALLGPMSEPAKK